MNVAPKEAANLELTVSHQNVLPEAAKDRELSILYHAAFWITEQTDEAALDKRLAALLRDGLQVEEAQIFGADGTLKEFSGPSTSKPVIKLGDFIKAQFQSITDAHIFLGRDLARHQQRIGNFNYLVAPLRGGPATTEPAGFIVLLRPVDWREFVSTDRVLLQAVGQLWSRGVTKITRDHPFARGESQPAPPGPPLHAPRRQQADAGAAPLAGARRRHEGYRAARGRNR